ncbi:Acetyl-synthetase-like protein [Lasiodiplodia theobromae]|uniref:Acetyl-synthetase-like protein n=1 Tax=Lasiodiplodia theobromae TaxID=45133 RepID=UPI0015C3D32F|nr:Acetyl-synthetase-like protein [Lasiodiplodia theobromae]KAF4542568.1 Acetyl-synthetase-like protein [Lasiodiplodia theobromae]
MDTNYFVCTLGQAASLSEGDSSFNNINEFLDLQARAVGNKPAVGLFELLNGEDVSSGEVPQPGSPSLKHRTITFSELRNGSLIVADMINRKHGESLSGRQTVGFLSPSSPTFIFVWLALMRLGHSVLLVAPQCQPPAIAHLLHLCEASTLFHDPSLQTAAAKTAEHVASATDSGTGKSGVLSTISLSSVIPTGLLSSIKTASSSSSIDSLRNTFPAHHIRRTDVAFLFHTSGTSSGQPKPIPQTHGGAACALPQHLPGSAAKATFTTTPLYHGGIADCFRAWTSDAPVCLFPGHALPITAANVGACLDVAAAAAVKEAEEAEEGAEEKEDGALPPVRYFSSVPYVLQMLEADASGAGVRRLRGMELVGVGGAALPAEVGDRLVEKGVRLVSRYGSAECGFLMSSHREYETDREWQYLRCDEAGGKYLRFESGEGNGGKGLAELVVSPGWPHMAKTNREDGSFATADLMMPHPTIPNAWKYHSRADSQLTLVTGKKFDPAPLESAIAASPFLDDVLIFGNGRPFPGALLFPSEGFAATSDGDLIDAVKPLVEKLNEESQQHARIPRNMLVPMPRDHEALEKSSKGTVMRGKAEEKYADVIEESYTKLGAGAGSKVPDSEVTNFIIDLIESVIPKSRTLEEDDDLFSYGVDSVACMQIRYGLNQILPKTSPELPLSVVEDCGTVKRLSNFMLKLRHGESYEESEDDLELMLNLVEKYGNFNEKQKNTFQANGSVNGEDAKDVVLLTGATGALGAHILHLYRVSDQTSKIYCLVRGTSSHTARERVDKALIQKGLPGLTASGHPDNSKIIVLQAQLGDSNLGLSEETYANIAAEATIIMHIAWSVNFRMRLRSFEKDNIAGLHNLLTLSLRSPRPSPPFFAYCSSVASATNYPHSPTIPERLLDSPAAASPLGYSRSKWVAEHVCQRAHDHYQQQQQQQQQHTSSSDARNRHPGRRRIAVFRVGQLSGDTRNGVWNAREAWPLMLSTGRLTGCLPALPAEPLGWLPVDVAARAFVEAVGAMGDGDRHAVAGRKDDGEGEGRGGQDVKVYHVLNEHCDPDWMRLLSWLKKLEDFEVVEPGVWLERLEEARSGNGETDHPALKLLGLWKDAYGNVDHLSAADEERVRSGSDRRTFAMEETKKVAPALRNVRPVDEKYFGKIWKWLCDVKME